MGWIELANGALKLVNWFTDQAYRSQLINEGEKNAIQASMATTLEVLQRAKERHKRVGAMSDDELDSEL